MLSKIQEQILNSCCNGEEIFYFIFAEVNFGGQVFNKTGNEIIKISADEIIDNIVILQKKGLIFCVCRGQKINFINEEYLKKLYSNYNCVTLIEHEERYSNRNDCKFRATEEGIKLIS